MPWCLKCKTEYVDGISFCSECNSPLQEELIEKEVPTPESIEEAFLISVGDKIEAEIIVDTLKANGIPALKKHRESGAYLDIYMGMTSLGVDIYVPIKQLEQAKQLVQIENISAPDEDMKNAEEDYNKKRRLRAWIVLIFFVPGLIGILFIIAAMILDKLGYI